MGNKKILLKIFLAILIMGAGVMASKANEKGSQVKWPVKRAPEMFKEIIKKGLPEWEKSRQIEKCAESYLRKMSMEEKIGQLFIIALDNDKEGRSMTALDDGMKKKLQETHVGGVILFKGNIADKQQTKALIGALQENSSIPLFISVDEEGGRVSRVGNNANINGTPFKSASQLGKSQDAKNAYKEAARIGKLLKELGFNMDFAPCADIYNNPVNTVIGDRSFGTSSEEVTSMVIAFAKGLKDEGIFPVMKHYPGHGNTMEDSHDGLAYVHKDIAELEKEELVPFEEAARAGVSGMMKGHLLVRSIDENWPVSLSEKWKDYTAQEMNGEEMLFVTDALNMGAIVNNYGEEEVVLRSFLAGNDLLLMPKDIVKAEEVLYKAYKTGVITEDQINHAVRKILTKKVEQNILLFS